MRFWTDIHGSQKINLNDFGDPLTLPLAPTAGRRVLVLSDISRQLFDSIKFSIQFYLARSAAVP